MKQLIYRNIVKFEEEEDRREYQRAITLRLQKDKRQSLGIVQDLDDDDDVFGDDERKTLEIEDNEDQARDEVDQEKAPLSRSKRRRI